MKRIFYPAAVTTAVVSLGLYGCGRGAPSGPATSNVSSTTDEHGDHTGHAEHEHADHAQHDHDSRSDMEKMQAELAKLSPEDRASAEKQHFCPVSGHMLGTDGAPQKIDVNGRQVWICCGDCKDELLASPDQYLAKLPKE